MSPAHTQLEGVFLSVSTHSDSENMEYSEKNRMRNLIYFHFFQLRCMFRGKIFFCTFCILNVVSIITQLLIWSGFKEGGYDLHALCSVETLCTIGFLHIFVH